MWTHYSNKVSHLFPEIKSSLLLLWSPSWKPLMEKGSMKRICGGLLEYGVHKLFITSLSSDTLQEVKNAPWKYRSHEASSNLPGLSGMLKRVELSLLAFNAWEVAWWKEGCKNRVKCKGTKLLLWNSEMRKDVDKKKEVECKNFIFKALKA